METSYAHENCTFRFLGCFYILKKQSRIFSSTFLLFFRPKFIIHSICQKAFLKLKNELRSDFSKIQLFFIFQVCSHMKTSYGHENCTFRFLGCFYIIKKQSMIFSSTFPLFFRPKFIIHSISQKAFFEAQK